MFRKKPPVILRHNLIEGAADIREVLLDHNLALSVERRGLNKGRVAIKDTITGQKVALGDLLNLLKKGVITNVRNDED